MGSIVGYNKEKKKRMRAIYRRNGNTQRDIIRKLKKVAEERDKYRKWASGRTLKGTGKVKKKQKIYVYEMLSNGMKT